MEDFKKELEQNWVQGLKEIDRESEELRKDTKRHKWSKWLSRVKSK